VHGSVACLLALAGAGALLVHGARGDLRSKLFRIASLLETVLDMLVLTFAFGTPCSLWRRTSSFCGLQRPRCSSSPRARPRHLPYPRQNSRNRNAGQAESTASPPASCVSPRLRMVRRDAGISQLLTVVTGPDARRPDGYRRFQPRVGRRVRRKGAPRCDGFASEMTLPVLSRHRARPKLARGCGARAFDWR
jgi:hypothetical protein